MLFFHAKTLWKNATHHCVMLNERMAFSLFFECYFHDDDGRAVNLVDDPFSDMGKEKSFIIRMKAEHKGGSI